MGNKLYYLTINVTNRCNLSCAHCYASSGSSLEKDLSLPVIKKVVDDGKTLGLLYVLITGGEPLMRDDLEELLSYLKSSGITVFLATNGTLLNEKNIRFIKNSVDKINISLDGVSEVHDKIRAKSGLFEETVNKIKKLINYKIPVSVSFTAHDGNFGQIEKLADYFNKDSDLKNVHINLKRYLSVGRGVENKIQLSKENYFKIIKIVEKLKNKKVNISFKDPFYSTSYSKGGGCFAGIHILSIKNNGEVWICTKLELPLGNINKTSLIDIWNNSEILKSLRNNSSEVVKGCRAAAYISSGNILSKDPVTSGL